MLKFNLLGLIATHLITWPNDAQKIRKLPTNIPRCWERPSWAPTGLASVRPPVLEAAGHRGEFPVTVARRRASSESLSLNAGQGEAMGAQLPGLAAGQPAQGDTPQNSHCGEPWAGSPPAKVNALSDQSLGRAWTWKLQCSVLSALPL